jgi:hypothetical protein
MMATRARFSIRTFLAMSALLGVLLAGCGSSAGSFGLDVELVDETTVARSVRYVEGQEEGPVYQISLTVPEEWVGNFITRNTGNVLYFDYLNEDGHPAPLFAIEALSFGQFWKQTGPYAGEQVGLRNTVNTHFVYRMPIDAYYSGLPQETFLAISEQVPGIFTTFDVTAVP